MDWKQRIVSYAKYKYRAKSHQRIHSPFVFNLLDDVFYTNSQIDQKASSKLEKRRAELLKSSETIQVTDLGAGAHKWKSNQRKISSIAKNSLKRKKYALLIHKIAHHFQPQTTLELGTSLGITTAYISQGFRNGQVITVEGCPNIAQLAQKTFQSVQANNIQQLIGNFNEVLPKFLSTNPKLDLVFIDGNHAYEPTLNYFNQTLQHTHNETVFIFDDIHWSTDMEKAWEAIKQHPKVSLTIDIYEMGLVFIREENKAPEHFVIKY